MYTHLVLFVTHGLPSVKCKCLSNVKHLLNFHYIKTNNITHLLAPAAVDFTCLSQIDKESSLMEHLFSYSITHVITMIHVDHLTDQQTL